MRITSGIWRGRELRVPRTGVRPAQDQLRQAIFSSLGAVVEGARVLDLFAGTGAYGLEALSRGADSACWVERDARILALLKSNARILMGESELARRAQFIAGDARIAPVLSRAGEGFDLIFADPPYEASEEGQWEEQMLRQLSGPVLRPGGWLVWEAAARSRVPDLPPGWTRVRDRHRGNTAWRIYGKEPWIAPLGVATGEGVR